MIGGTLAAIAVMSAALVGGSLSASSANAPARFVDDALGISFVLPRGTYYHPARRTDAAFPGQVVAGWLSTFPQARPPKDSDYLVIEFDVELGRGADHITDHVRTPRLTAALKRAQLIGGRPAVELRGIGINGLRSDAFVAFSNDRVLRISAYPMTSPRIGLLEQVVGSIRFGASP